MNVQKKIDRTRKIVVKVDAHGTMVQAIVVDHYDSDDPKGSFSGDKVGLTIGGGVVQMIPIQAWPILVKAVDRAISEFKAAYPESPQ